VNGFFTTINTTSSNRDAPLECLKGLIIILVVLGHIPVSGTPPTEQTWFDFLRQVIYTFHMPAFFVLSGIIFYSQSLRTFEKSPSPFSATYLSFIRERANRLLVPFILLGTTAAFAKYIFFSNTDVGQKNLSLTEGMLNIFIATEQSPVRFIWFLAAMFTLSVITLPILYADNKRKKSHFLITATLISFVLFFYFPQAPDIFYLNRILKHALFFFSGIAIAKNLLLFQSSIKNLELFFILLLMTTLAIAMSYPFSSLVRIALVAWPATLVLMTLSQNFKGISKKSLLILGKYSMVIYLFNLPCMGMFYVISQKIFHPSPVLFNVFILVFAIGGIVGPILAKEIVFKKVPFLNRMTN
jgi:fucose 4-O-acetylase-like acetyltransferase